MKAALTALLLVAALPAAAASVYECTDSQGRRTYTQNPGSNCRPSKLGRPSIYTSAPVYSAPPAASPAPAESPTTANQGDIAAAQQQLEQARKNLEEGKKVRYGNERNYVRYQERIAGLEQAVEDAQQKLNAAQQSGGSGNSSAQ